MPIILRALLFAFGAACVIGLIGVAYEYFRRANVLAIALLLALASTSASASHGKPVVFVTGDDSWQTSSPSGATSASSINATAAEGIKLVQQNCSGVAVNMRRDKADYVIALSDDGSGSARKGRRAVVFTPDGQVVFVNSTRSLKNAVKDACTAIAKDWPSR